MARRGSLQEAMLVHQACVQFDEAQTTQIREEAEAFLIAFRRSVKPYSICKHILDKSPCVSAQFHATVTLREAIIREWSLFSFVDLVGLRNELLGFAISRTLPSVVFHGLLQTVAVMFKRSWLDDEAKVIVELRNQLQQLHNDPNTQLLGLALSSKIIQEFASRRSSALGLPMEAHIRGHISFEATLLRDIFLLSIDCLQRGLSLASDAKFTERQLQLAQTCLSVMEAVFDWAFVCGQDASFVFDALGQPRNMEAAALCLTPGAAWGCLTDDRWLDYLCELHARLAAYVSLHALTYSSLLATASLTGEVFASDSDRIRFATRLARLVSQVHAAAPDVPDSALRTCQVLSRLAINQPLDTVLRPAFANTSFFSQLVQLSLRSLPNPADADDGDEVCVDSLRLWVHLAKQLPYLRPPGPEDAALCSAMQLMFAHLSEWRVMQSGAGYAQQAKYLYDEDSMALDSLADLAYVGRVHMAITLSRLSGLMDERIQRLSNQLSRAGVAADADSLRTQAELMLLALLLGCVLTYPPRNPREPCQNVPPTLSVDPSCAPEAFARLLALLQLVARLPMAGTGAQHPGLLRAALWLARRWGGCYLSGNSELSRLAPLQPWCAEGSVGHARAVSVLAELAVRGLQASLLSPAKITDMDPLASRVLVMWDGVLEFGPVRCETLKCEAVSVLLSAWAQLDAKDADSFSQLPHEAQTGLARVLAVLHVEAFTQARRADRNQADPSAAGRARMAAFLAPLSGRLASYTSPQFAQACFVPETLRHVSVSLSLLAGVGRVSGRVAGDALLPLTRAWPGAVALLLNGYAGYEGVDDVFERGLEALSSCTQGWLEVMPEPEARGLVAALEQSVSAWERQLQFHARANPGADCGSAGIEAVLRVLAPLLTKPTCDRSNTRFQSYDFCIQAFVAFLGCVTHLARAQLWQRPRLLEEFAGLLELMLEFHPEAFARLPAQTQQAATNTALYAMQHADTRTAKTGLAIAMRMGQACTQLRRMGKDFSSCTGCVAALLGQLLRQSLGEAWPAAQLKHAADAAFMLIACDLQSFATVVQQVLTSQPVTAQAKLQHCCEVLAAGVREQLSEMPTPDSFRSAALQARFEDRFRRFLLEVWGALQTR
jgi:hypothetical protein